MFAAYSGSESDIEVLVYASNAEAMASFLHPAKLDGSDKQSCVSVDKPAAQRPSYTFEESGPGVTAASGMFTSAILVDSVVVQASASGNLPASTDPLLTPSYLAKVPNPILTPQPIEPNLAREDAVVLARAGMAALTAVEDPSYAVPSPLPFLRITAQASLSPSPKLAKVASLTVQITNVGLPIADLLVESASDSGGITGWFAAHNVDGVPSQCRATDSEDAYACGPVPSRTRLALVFTGTPKVTGLAFYPIDFYAGPPPGTAVVPSLYSAVPLADKFGGELVLGLSETVSA